MLWLVLSRSGFCSSDRFHVFLFWSEAGKFKICSQNSEKKKLWIICHSSHWNYQKKLKRLKFFRNFKDRWRRQTFLSASHRKCILLSETECHIINHLLTELARSVLGNIGPRSRQYGPCFAWMSCKCAFQCTRFNWGVNCRNKKCTQNFSVFATLCFQIAHSLIIYLCLFTS